MKFICNQKGKALYCQICRHGKLHSLHVWGDLTESNPFGIILKDCREPSRCSVIGEFCQCVESEIELIP
jgi:hypothetical protein